MLMKLMAGAFRLVASAMQALPLKRRIVLMSRQSSKPSLDFKMLAQKLQSSYPDVEVSMCLTQPELASKVAFAAGTLKQLKVASTAKVVVADGYIPAVCIPTKRSGASVMQMWHALGAVKKFGYQSVDTPAGRSAADAQAACMHKNYDCIVAGSIGSVPFFAQAFGYPASAVKTLGLPRIDYLVDSSEQSSRRVQMAAIAASNPVFANGKTTVLYAPTLRKGANYEGWLDRAVHDLASHCDASRVNFIVAGHPLNNHVEQSALNGLEHVSFIQGASTIDLLGLADCVITDYSAVAFEAGIISKPVFFYVPDIDVYRSSPGLNIDPLAEYPNVSSKDAAELMSLVAQHTGDSGAIEQDSAFAAMIDRDFAPLLDGKCTARIAAELAAMLDRS